MLFKSNSNNKMVNEKRIIGDIAEERAAEFLKDSGLEILKRNYECKVGELDIIARDGEYYVFVEVRYRKKEDFIDGLESITPKKKSNIIRAAKYYLLQNDLYDSVSCRFDVVAIDDSVDEDCLTWVQDAFWVKWN